MKMGNWAFYIMSLATFYIEKRVNFFCTQGVNYGIVGYTISNLFFSLFFFPPFFFFLMFFVLKGKVDDFCLKKNKNVQTSSDKGAWAHQSRYVFFYKDEKNLKHQLGIEALQNNSRSPCSTCNPSSVAFVTRV
jgi:hypothetical protein